MIFFIHGADSFRSRQKLHEIKEKFIKEVDPSKVNIELLDGATLSFDEFKKAVLSPPFLAKRRLVIVENIISKNKSKTIGASIKSFLEEHSDLENAIVFWEREDGTESRSKKKKPVLFSFLTKQPYSQECKLFTGFNLERWIKKEIENRNGNISNMALKNLASFVGSDLWQMSKEIDKLLAYTKVKEGQREIVESDVYLLVCSSSDNNIFTLMDQISSKNKAAALSLLEEQLGSGINPLYFLTMLVRQFRILLKVKIVLEKTPWSQDAVFSLGLHPFVAKKAMSQSKGYSLEQLKNIYQQLLAIDAKIKTGQAKPTVLFDLFLVKTA